MEDGRWPALLGLYLASRLAGLAALPMFLDERIHLRWAQWIAQGRRLRLPFISGRGLSVYMLAALTPQASDPLLVGRLLTVAVGIVTMAAVHRLALRASGDRRAADAAALFSIACPFTLLYDRMVLTDAFLSAATALTLVLALSVAEEPRARSGVLLGIAIALGILAKTTGLVLFVVPLLAWLAVAPDRRRAAPALAAAYAVAGALVAYPLWLFFRKTDELSGALGTRENEDSLAGNAAANLRLAAEWLWAYWTPGLALLALAGLVLVLLGKTRPGGRGAALLLGIVTVGPTLAFVAVSEIWYPRYLLFTTVPLVALAGWGFVATFDLLHARLLAPGARAGPWAALALALLLVPALRFDLALWTDPSRAPFPALDRFQYVTGWPSGYGTHDSIAFLRAQRERTPAGLVLVTPGPSTTASAVRLFWARDSSVDVQYVAPDAPASALQAAAAGRPLFVVVSRPERARLPEQWSPVLAAAFASYKPDGTAADAIYRLCPAGSCP
jgi:dolichyl-phosphate-mannose-protein mannosyltransferase